VGKLLRAADQLTPTARFPLRHLIMPEIFRLLCGCGFRLGEVLHLRLADVDLQQGILTVRDGKFGKDRLVPPAPALVVRLRKYAEHFGARLLFLSLIRNSPADFEGAISPVVGDWRGPRVSRDLVADSRLVHRREVRAE
jgi:integrase